MEERRTPVKAEVESDNSFGVVPDLANVTEEEETPSCSHSQAAAKIENTNDDFSTPNLPIDCKDSYDNYINQVKTVASVSLLNSITPAVLENFKPYNIRYYEDKYCIDFAKFETGHNDTLIRIHTNKLFLISLGNGNDIITCNKNITAINFIINKNDRSVVNLKGKFKRGAKVIEPGTILCQVKCEGVAKLFNIRAGVPGRVIEINELVKERPNLLRTDPKGDGFLAVLAPMGHPSKYEEEMNKLKLLSEEEYMECLCKRTPNYSDSIQCT